MALFEADRISGAGSSADQALVVRLVQGGLTEGEAQVALLMRDGLANQAIASRCCFSLNTVKSYLSRAYVKLGVENRAQLSVHQGVLTTGRLFGHCSTNLSLFSKAGW